MATIQKVRCALDLVITPAVALQLSDLTRRRFVALYPIGFEMIIGDDGRSQFRIWDEDGLAARMDQALAHVVQDSGSAHWVVYDQLHQNASLVPAARARQSIASQQLVVANIARAGVEGNVFDDRTS